MNSEPGRPALDCAAGGGQNPEPRWTRPRDRRGRTGSPVDGAVGVDSLVAVAAVALLAPSALGLLPRLLVPQVVLLLVDGILIGLYVLGLGTPGDVQVLADVGLGFVFGLPATRSTWGCSARTRAGAQPLLIRLSRVRPRGRCRRSRPESPPHRRGRLRTVRPHHTALPHRRGSNARVRAPAAPPARTHHTQPKPSTERQLSTQPQPSTQPTPTRRTPMS